MAIAAVSESFSSTSISRVGRWSKWVSILIAVGVALSSWAIDSLFDAFVFSGGTFVGELFNPGYREFTMRLIIALGAVSFTYYYLKLRHTGLLLTVEVTERKRAEERLRFTQFTVDNFADAIFWADSYGRLIYVNSTVLERYGYTEAELYQMTVMDMDPQFPADAWQPYLIELKQKGRLRFESQHRTKSGEIFPVEITNNYFTNEDGGVICGIIRDITKSKQAAAALLTSQHNLAEAQNLAHVGSWELDLVHNRLTWSEQMYSIFGLLPNDEFGATYEAFLDAVHPDDRDRVDQAYRSSLGEGGQYNIEYRIIRKSDGQLRWGHARSEHERDVNGKAIRSFGTVQDITERKQTEAKINHSQERMKRAQSLARIGDWERDLKTNDLIWSDEMFRLMDLPPGDSRGTYQNFLAHVHPDDRESVVNLATHAAKEGKFYSAEYRLVHDDGTTLFIHATADIARDSYGNPIRLIGTAQDITERKEMEKERARFLDIEKKARAEAEKSNLLKDEFLAMLSHELRTPLTTILAWTQMLRMGKLDDKQTKHGIEVLEQSANAQGQLINDLLDISRIQAGKLSLTIQEIDPSMVISAAIDSIQSIASSKSIQIETAIDPSVKMIFADPARLQQILWNLITNAVKFSPKESRIKITLDRMSSAAGERIRFQVRDNGKGISPEFIPFIFERFRQADSTCTRSYSGLGLGLAIAKKLAEMHEGTITVESPGEGKGATFTVYLPVNSPAKVSTFNAASEADSKTDVSLRGLRILAVEDDASSREAFLVMLQLFGAEVKTAESVSKALEVFEDFKPDVLVSDIAMPIEDGYSLIKKIRALKSDSRNTPAIAVTAYAGEVDIQHMLRGGFQSHMAKPVDAKKLALAIAGMAKNKNTSFAQQKRN